jgi:hypothetical protein
MNTILCCATECAGRCYAFARGARITHLAICLSGVVACAVLSENAIAGTQFSQLASDNATVQTTGPRGGSNGKNFLNVFGSATNPNTVGSPSFGVADFNFRSLQPFGGTVTGVDTVSLVLTESNNSASATGPISVYYTDNTTASIQFGTSTLEDQQPNNDGAASVDPALTSLSLLGSGSFSDSGSGNTDSVSLNFSGNSLTAFLSALNNTTSTATTLRLVITADASSTIATFVGTGSTSGLGPTLDFNATVAPEPSTLVLALLALVGFAACRKLRGGACMA